MKGRSRCKTSKRVVTQPDLSLSTQRLCLLLERISDALLLQLEKGERKRNSLQGA
uniref:Uncharacterized protein n=1 Tax=Arundo donax TaxID=35708 RepID=A0A0A9A960_ARUDO